MRLSSSTPTAPIRASSASMCGAPIAMRDGTPARILSSHTLRARVGAGSRAWWRPDGGTVVARMTGASRRRSRPCAGGVACSSTRPTRTHGRRLGCRALDAKDGKEAPMVGGRATSSRGGTATPRERRHGSTTSEQRRRQACGGERRAPPPWLVGVAITRAPTSDGGVSATPRHRPRRLHSATSCSPWRVPRRWFVRPGPGRAQGAVGVDVLVVRRDDRTTRTRHASRLGDA